MERGHSTFSTSVVAPSATFVDSARAHAQQRLHGTGTGMVMAHASMVQTAASEVHMQIQRDESTINGVVIGLLSSFGSAVLIALIFLVVYFFRYTSSGRILLDRIGRPGEYDDEQAFAKEEAEALEQMDDLQRTEYLRAKGRFAFCCS